MESVGDQRRSRTIGKIFISNAHKERGGSAVFSVIVHRTIAACGRSKTVDPRSCAGGTRRQDRCDGIAPLTFAVLAAVYLEIVLHSCHAWKSPACRASDGRWVNTTACNGNERIFRPNRRGNLVWTSGRPFSSLRFFFFFFFFAKSISRHQTCQRVPNADKARFSAHCHDDLGMAVANSLAGVRAGIRQIECTINGIGERAGNAALEEVVMAMKVRNDVMPYWTNVDSTMLTRASKLVAAATSFPVQYNKAIVGRNAFAHESGIHQDGMLKHTQTYEIMTPETVGVKQTSLVMGKHSGRHAFVHKLEEMGYRLSGNQLEDAFVRFKALADKKKHIYDEDLEALVDEEIAHAQNRVKLVSLTVIAGTVGPQSATATLDIDGRHHTVQSTGNGPVDATFNCIKALIPHEAVLELYQVHAVTQGTDAQAEVSVRLAESGRSVTAKGADPDTLVASAKAYLGALNKLLSRRQKGTAEPLLPARRLHSTDVG